MKKLTKEELLEFVTSWYIDSTWIKGGNLPDENSPEFIREALAHEKIREIIKKR